MCQVRVTVRNSGFIRSFERLLTPLFIDSKQALWAWDADREIRMDQTVSLVSGYVYSRFGHENVTYIGTDSELRK